MVEYCNQRILFPAKVSHIFVENLLIFLIHLKSLVVYFQFSYNSFDQVSFTQKYYLSVYSDLNE